MAWGADWAARARPHERYSRHHLLSQGRARAGAMLAGRAWARQARHAPGRGRRSPGPGVTSRQEQTGEPRQRSTVFLRPGTYQLQLRASPDGVGATCIEMMSGVILVGEDQNLSILHMVLRPPIDTRRSPLGRSETLPSLKPPVQKLQKGIYSRCDAYRCGTWLSQRHGRCHMASNAHTRAVVLNDGCDQCRTVQSWWCVQLATTKEAVGLEVCVEVDLYRVDF